MPCKFTFAFTIYWLILQALFSGSEKLLKFCNIAKKFLHIGILRKKSQFSGTDMRGKPYKSLQPFYILYT